VIVDSAGHVFVSGSTSSAPYSADAIVFVLDAATGVEIDRGVYSGTLQYASIGALGLDADENLDAGGEFYHVNTGVVDITLARYDSMVPPANTADLDGDGDVDVSDLTMLILAWGSCGDPRDCPTDLDGDGDTDVADLVELLVNWS
jgi:hypothetical protein